MFCITQKRIFIGWSILSLVINANARAITVSHTPSLASTNNNNKLRQMKTTATTTKSVLRYGKQTRSTFFHNHDNVGDLEDIRTIFQEEDDDTTAATTRSDSSQCVLLSSRGGGSGNGNGNGRDGRASKAAEIDAVDDVVTVVGKPNTIEKPWVDGLKNSLASALAAAVSKTVLAPFDTIKTLQQYHQSSTVMPSLTLWEAAKLINERPGGIINFYVRRFCSCLRLCLCLCGLRV